jgi:hypothetical protein
MTDKQSCPCGQATVTAAARPARRGAITCVEFDGEAVLLAPDNRVAHHLDPVGTLVWQLLDGNATIAELARDLAEAFCADPAVVESDVLALCRQLDGQGLLTTGPEDPAAQLCDGQSHDPPRPPTTPAPPPTWPPTTSQRSRATSPFPAAADGVLWTA